MKNYKCIKEEKNMHHNPVDPLRGELVVDNDGNKNYNFHYDIKRLANYGTPEDEVLTAEIEE